MPSALAVCRLMMNSNLLACMSTPYGLPPGHPRLELLPPHFLSGIRGGNGGAAIAIPLYGGCFLCPPTYRNPGIRSARPGRQEQPNALLTHILTPVARTPSQHFSL